MRKREQGILTVEASAVLTLMMFFILFLFSFGRVYRAQSLVSHATLQAADAIALESYLRETALQSDAADVVYLASNITDSDAISVESLQSLRSADLPKIAKEKFSTAVASSTSVADAKLKSLGVKDGLEGINFSQCQMDLANDDVVLAISYTVEMQFPLFGGNEIAMTKTAKAKTFGEILFEVSTKPNVPGWGTTTGDTKVMHGTEVELTAKPNYGYVFVEWDDGCKDSTRKVTVTDAQNYVAIFKKDKFGVNTSTVIRYNTAVAGMEHKNFGTVSGAGTYEYLDNATLTATPSPNYVFEGWDVNGDGVIDNQYRGTTINISVDKTYNVRAYFKPAIYTVTVKSNNTTYGTAQVSQGSNKGTSLRVEYGSNVQITAILKDSNLHAFTKWNDNITDQTRTVVVKQNVDYTANFILNTCTVTFYNEGSVVGQTTVIKGSSIAGSQRHTNSRMPNNPTLRGYRFSDWKCNNSVFTAETKINSNIAVSASWKYRVTLNANKGSVGWTTKDIDKGASVTLPTPTLNNHTFKGWNLPGINTYGASTYTFGGDVTLTAVWSCNHTVGKLIYSKTDVYCSDIYSNGNLISNAAMPYNEYECGVCGDTWKVTTDTLRIHRRMNFKDGYSGDDFFANCDTKHKDDHYGYCGKYSGKNGKYHTWDGYYHILCSYCHKEQQGSVWCYVDGDLVYYDLHKCAKCGSAGSVPCPF